MGTIEYIDQLFTNKINCLFEIYNEYKIIFDSDIQIKNLLDYIQDKYNEISINILYNYYITQNVNRDKNKNEIMIDYNRSIIQLSINEKIDILFNKLYKKKIIENRNIKYKKYIELIEKYESIFKYIYKYEKTDKQNNSICTTCNGIISINNETSEMICNDCGIIENIIGSVFDNVQVYNQEGFYTKHASYERVKHGEKWLNRIQARDNTEIKKSVINDIKKEFIIENITDIRKISYNLVRNCLRKTNNTKYNEYIPLIIKIITGISPPQLTEKEYSLTLKYFNKVVNIFEQIKPKDKSNCPYHPHFFRKILEQNCILPENNEEQLERKRKILSNIHIQSDNTLKKRDIIWKNICERIKVFHYSPTDKNKYKIIY